MADAIQERGVVAAAVLSGNRNFPGRVHGMLDHAFLASPPLVIAYALAGRVDLDIAESRGAGSMTRRPCFSPTSGLPTTRSMALTSALQADDFVDAFADQGGGAAWSAIDAPSARSSPGTRARPTCAGRPSWRSPHRPPVSSS